MRALGTGPAAPLGSALAGAACILVSATVGAQAAEPSFRYCEAGYARGFVDDGAVASDGVLGAFAVSASDGGGGRIACDFRLLGGIYVHGEYRRIELDAVAASGFPGPIVGLDDSLDATAKDWRVGVGYARDLIPGFVGYGQAALMRSNYYEEFDEAGSGFSGLDNSGVRTGLSLEAGLRAAFTRRFEISGYGRYDTEGAYGFSSTNGGLAFDEGDDFRGGIRASARILGPLSLSAGYEVGDLDIFFIGARAGF